MADEISIVVRADDQFSSVLGNFGNIMTGIKSTIDLVGQAFNAAVNFTSQFVNEATESQDAIANLESTLRSMGDVTGLTSQDFQDMAAALQNVTRFSDEAIINGQAMLLTFGEIGGDIFPLATQAMVDLAAKFGSIEQASVMLGKALNDPIAGVTALRRVGVQLTEDQQKSIEKFMELGDIAGAQAIILGEVERQVGGLAQAYGTTFAGQVDILKNRFGEIKEVIGNALLPILSQAMEKFLTWMPELEMFADKVASAISAFGETGFSSVEVQEVLDDIDIFIAQIFDTIAADIDAWVETGGPEALTNKIIGWVESIGTGPSFQSKAANAANNILMAITSAIGAIEWSVIAESIDNAIAGGITAIDFSAAGVAFGDKVEKAVNDFFTTEGIQFGSSSALDALGQGISDFFVNAMGYADWDEFGTAISVGFKEGLTRGLLGAIFPFAGFVEAVKKLFGISSPSTLFAEIGRNIVLGLMQGWVSAFNVFLSLIQAGLDLIIGLFEPILSLLGIDLNIGGGASTLPGPVGGTTSTGALTGGQPVTNNYYGPVYFGAAGEPGAYYDCPSPNPLLVASQGGLVMPSIG